MRRAGASGTHVETRILTNRAIVTKGGNRDRVYPRMTMLMLRGSPTGRAHEQQEGVATRTVGRNALHAYIRKTYAGTNSTRERRAECAQSRSRFPSTCIHEHAYAPHAPAAPGEDSQQYLYPSSYCTLLRLNSSIHVAHTENCSSHCVQPVGAQARQRAEHEQKREAL